MFLHNRIFPNSLLCIKGGLLYEVRTKLQNKITKHNLHSMITHILMSWFKTVDPKQKHRKHTQKDKKTIFSKETVENADLHKAAWNKTTNTQE